MSNFKLETKMKPSGSQPEAINFIVDKIENNEKNIVLNGVTGSGKTFTIANVINKINKPVILISHNKTLASQLYSELKSFFPNNAVEYYISYFDYFRPEAYKPDTDTYIEKESQTNEQIEIMRLSTINSLLNRKDVIVVASVSAIYGALNPEIYKKSFYRFFRGQNIELKTFIRDLTKVKYERNDLAPKNGNFAVKGDNVFIYPSDKENEAIRVSFFGDEIEEIANVDPLNKNLIKKHIAYILSPGDEYAVDNNVYDIIIPKIKKELKEQLNYFNSKNKILEAQRLSQRITSDIDEMEEFGMCKGIENYSMYLDGREIGQRPYTLLDYLPKDSLMIIDESHLTVPQMGGMYKGDQARKDNLVNYGFRLPSAKENRPLSYDEVVENFDFTKIFISATPSEYEINISKNNIAKMYVRPTGLLDPKISIKPTLNQVDDIYDTIIKERESDGRTIVLTTSKESAEKLNEYLINLGIKSWYVHSEHNTFERNEIIRKFRLGDYETIVGINLLREGIDIPELTKVLILEADAQGFMRSATSLKQIVGRASRNAKGEAIFYADKISQAMKECIEDNIEKRKIQEEYNKKYNIIPKTILKEIPESIYGDGTSNSLDLILSKKSKFKKKEIVNIIEELTKKMEEASKQRDYEKAIELRDMIYELKRDKK
ncbi:excinuclease ABC subunit UvrB [Mycoplasma sp. CSL7503-lung]|uniref:excinuclease ABC subunit UvrB n=1 Tax=Mycoplasma sp. CSL7503-lung TaxID=536372 RepID=UPI0021CECFCB|nr:excinuclease ABC subunit UvrB [Mycoplasma sp. CSL7503-lung]MCU4706515.1 excinuclease ABC subunit UvrB [Mycoplasma sp. CSL7503-lung]